MIKIKNDIFILETMDTSYILKKDANGLLKHLYYGKKIKVDDHETFFAPLELSGSFLPGNAIRYDKTEPGNIFLEDELLEISSPGKGDFREPFIELVHPDGTVTSDFVFDSFETYRGKKILADYPSSYAVSNGSFEKSGIGSENISDTASDVCTLKIHLLDRNMPELKLTLIYTVFEKENVIVRSGRLDYSKAEADTGSEGSSEHNASQDKDQKVHADADSEESKDLVFIKKFYSSQLDLDDPDLILTTFNNAWSREMNRVDQPITVGRHMNSRAPGVSTNISNPFFMVESPDTTEDHGNVYGFNIIYSGCHSESVEKNEFGLIRVLAGIDPDVLDIGIGSGGSFQVPEEVLSFSDKGYNGLSRNMHTFINDHIIAFGKAHRRRKILFNSWEAAYFKISESKLLSMAKDARDLGAQIFVVDDGWFIGRDSDNAALGDWTVDNKKFPHGLRSFGEKLKSLGLEFGIWVEPEMISEKSRLFEEHPDWALKIPGKSHSEGRNQMLLDLSRTEVQDHIIKVISDLLNSADIKYVKWDFNRVMTDMFSACVKLYPESHRLNAFYDPEHNAFYSTSVITQDGNEEKPHKERFGTEIYIKDFSSYPYLYYQGLYRVMKVLTDTFPQVLFEGCASGGSRFDLGMLSMFPQIWASDDTDPIERAFIQRGCSYGYPLSAIGTHISSSPNHGTLRNTPLGTRAAISLFGAAGIELDTGNLTSVEKEQIREFVKIYSETSAIITEGSFYRTRPYGNAVLDQIQSFVNNSALLSPDSVLSRYSQNICAWNAVSPDKSASIGMVLQVLNIPDQVRLKISVRGLDPDALYEVVLLQDPLNVKVFGDLINTMSPVHIRQNGFVHGIIEKKVKLRTEELKVKAYGSALSEGGLILPAAYAGTGFDEKTRVFPDFSARLIIARKIK